MRGHESILHFAARASYVAAFVRISRSSVTRANARFDR
jgi:hypothetical protein